MFITAYNYNTLSPEIVQEKVSDELLVEPSESYTVRELVYRLAMGMPISSGIRSGEYPDRDEDFDDVLPTEEPDFDLADYARMKEEVEERQAIRKMKAEQAYQEKLKKDKALESSETVSTSETISE